MLRHRCRRSALIRTARPLRGGRSTSSTALDLFDEQELAEITHPDFLGEWLGACRNPMLAEDRARNYRELLEAAERELAKVWARVDRERRPL